MLSEDKLTKYFRNIYKTAPGFTGVCYRAVRIDYADQHTVIQASGSFIAGGRYNMQADFGALYLSCDPKTCIEECVQSIHINPTEMVRYLPRMIVGLKVDVSKVLKLNKEIVLNPTTMRKIDLLDLDWKDKQTRGEEIKTQLVGKIARSVGFEAIMVPSARRDGCNLNLFPDKLIPTSKITLVNVGYLSPTSRKYDEACSESLDKLKTIVKRDLTDQERKSLFCPLGNIVCS